MAGSTGRPEPPPRPAVLPESTLDTAVDLLANASDGARYRLPVQGPSMLPTLAPGGEILVSLGRFRPALGDVALFSSVSGLVVHRCAGTRPSGDSGERALRFRGDGRATFDPPVPYDRVRGRVVAIRRDGAWWSLEGFRARLYARALGLHALAWGFAIAVAARLERDVAGTTETPRGDLGGLARALAAADQGLLRAVDGLAFAWMHRRSDPDPAGTAHGDPLL